MYNVTIMLSRCSVFSEYSVKGLRMFRVVAVLARDLTSCQPFVTKLKNLRNLKNLRISKTPKLRFLCFPSIFKFFRILKKLNFEISEIFEDLIIIIS